MNAIQIDAERREMAARAAAGMYEYSECDEIADNMKSLLPGGGVKEPSRVLTFDECLAMVKQQMPDESVQVQDNVAYSLMRRTQTQAGWDRE